MRRFVAYISSILIIGGLAIGAIEMFHNEYRSASALSTRIQKEGFDLGLKAANNRQCRAYLEERDRLNAEEIQRYLNEACEKDAQRLIGD